MRFNSVFKGLTLYCTQSARTFYTVITRKVCTGHRFVLDWSVSRKQTPRNTS